MWCDIRLDIRDLTGKKEKKKKKVLIEFSRAFFISLRIVDFTFLGQNWLNGIT